MSRPTNQPWSCLGMLLFVAVAVALMWLDYAAYMDRFPHAHWWSWLVSLGGGR